MKNIALLTGLIISTTFCSLHLSAATNEPGFFLDERALYTEIPFRKSNNLMIIPVSINGEKHDMILDTGLKSVVLFGKKFDQMVNTSIKLKVNGWGNGKPTEGRISAGNTLKMGGINGESISILVIRERNALPLLSPGIDGIIGYEIFSKFQVHIDNNAKKIRISRAIPYMLDETYTGIPITIKDTKPYINCKIMVRGKGLVNAELMLDTGADKHVMFDNSFLPYLPGSAKHYDSIGWGMGGNISGYSDFTVDILLENIILSDLLAEVSDRQIKRSTENIPVRGVLGLKALDQYEIIFDYANEMVYVKAKQKCR